MKLCLVCSTGGHLFQMHLLKPFWEKHERFWVSFPGSDSEYLLAHEKKYWAYHPTNRSLKNFLKNIFLAIKILKRERPTVIITTGAGVGVPFIYLGRLFGVRTIYVESITRINNLSISAKLVYPFVHQMFVQWPDLAVKYKKCQFEGQVV